MKLKRPPEHGGLVDINQKVPGFFLRISAD